MVRINWRAFGRNRPALLAALFLAATFLLGLAAPLRLARPNDVPLSQGVAATLQSPSVAAPFGTDRLGRDLLGRVMWGARVSLAVGALSAMISAVVGVLLGMTAGYAGGAVDLGLMRLVDMVLMLPRFFLILFLVSIFGASTALLVLVIGLTSWPSTARLTRAECLTVREREFVQAARVSGARPFRIAVREILPNALSPAIVNTSLLAADAVFLESALGFLGLSDPSTASWGRILNDALPSFQRAWWTVAFAGLAIAATVMSFNLVGDGLNEALNPRRVEAAKSEVPKRTARSRQRPVMIRSAG